LISEWREEDRRQKRFYRLSPEGRELLRQLMTEWQNINASITRIAAAKH
jgi:PadR family transcriptional regulator PadR